MPQPEIDERIRILHDALRKGINADENHSKLVRQIQQRGNTAQARQRFSRSEVEDLARQLSQGCSHPVGSKKKCAVVQLPGNWPVSCGTERGARCSHASAWYTFHPMNRTITKRDVLARTENQPSKSPRGRDRMSGKSITTKNS